MRRIYKRYTVASILSVVIVFFVSSITSLNLGAATPSHRLNSAELGFYLDGDGSRVRFDTNYIYLGDGTTLWSYINDDAVRFYNLRVGDSSVYPSWTVAVSGPANLTITRLFVSDVFEADVYAETDVTSTVIISCPEDPLSVEGADTYSWQNGLLTLSQTHASSRHLKVTLPDIYSQMREENRNQVFRAISLLTIVFVIIGGMMFFCAYNRDIQAVIVLAMVALVLSLVLTIVVMLGAKV